MKFSPRLPEEWCKNGHWYTPHVSKLNIVPVVISSTCGLGTLMQHSHHAFEAAPVIGVQANPWHAELKCAVTMRLFARHHNHDTCGLNGSVRGRSGSLQCTMVTASSAPAECSVKRCPHGALAMKLCCGGSRAPPASPSLMPICASSPRQVNTYPEQPC